MWGYPPGATASPIAKGAEVAGATRYGVNYAHDPEPVSRFPHGVDHRP